MKALISVVFSLVLLGCKWLNKGNTSTPKGDARLSAVFTQKFNIEHTVDGLPQHVAVDMREYAKAQWLAPPDKKLEILPAGHPVEKEIQSLVHSLHTAFVKANPRYAAIPEPQALIIKDDNPNAFTIPAGILVPIRVVSTKKIEKPYPRNGWIGVADGFLIDAENTHGFMDIDESGKPPAWVLSRPELLNSLLAAVQKNMPECSLSMNGDVVTMADECYQKYASANKTDFGVVNVVGFVQAASAAGIFVHSGLVKFERRHVMSIVAHEMGHYYKFHTRETLREMAGYKHRWKEHYFRIPQYTDRTQKPPVDNSPAVLEMFNALSVGSAGRVSYRDFALKNSTSVIRQVYHLFEAIKWRGFRMMPPPTVDSCIALSQTFNELITRYGALPGEWHKAPRDLMLRADTQTSSCVQQLSVKTAGEWATSNTLNLEEKRRFYTAIQEELSNRLKRFPPIDDSFRVNSAMDFLANQAAEFDRQARELGTRAQQMGFGWYTDEQESDEIAVHLMALAGENPRSAADVFFKHLALFDTGGSSTVTPSLSECRKGFLNGWKDWRFNGVSWVPFFGYTYELHPTDCYRIFNIDKETEAFDYGKIPSSRDTASWKAAQISLQQ